MSASAKGLQMLLLTHTEVYFRVNSACEFCQIKLKLHALYDPASVTADIKNLIRRVEAEDRQPSCYRKALNICSTTVLLACTTTLTYSRWSLDISVAYRTEQLTEQQGV